MQYQSGSFDPIVRGIQVTPVAVGLTSWITTDYVAENMHLLEFADRTGAFMVYFACGVHFLGSFLLAVPVAALFAGKNRPWWVTFVLLASMFSYLFWSMLNAQTMVAELFTDGAWEIPLWGAPGVFTLGRQLNEPVFLFFWPLIFSWAVIITLLVALSPLALFGRRN